MKMYKTLKDLPTHSKGSILVETEDNYKFTTKPFVNYSKKEVEEYPNWFELIVENWEKGETFYYISTDFKVEEKEFNPIQHYKLVLSGNAFKNPNAADWLKKQIDKMITDDDLIITNNSEIMSIVSNLKSNNKEKAIDKLMSLL